MLTVYMFSSVVGVDCTPMVYEIGKQMAKAANAVTKARERRDAVLASKTLAPAVMTERQRATILRLLEEGATLSEIFTFRGICGYGSFYRARQADPTFDDSVRRALAQGAEAAIAEANELTRKAAESANPDDMRVAEAFHRCALAYAEKAAPREYGQLIKLGNPEGGPLSLSVVNYSIPLVAHNVPKDAPALDDGRARDLAEFDEVS